MVADPHVADGADGTWKVYHRAAGRFQSALRRAERLESDAVVVPGDLTRDGRPAEFDRVDALFASADVPVVAVPGNHDVPKSTDDHDTPAVGEFADSYAGGEFPVVRQVGGVDVVGVNTAGGDGRLWDTHEGGVSASQLDRVDAALAGADAPLLVAHHPLADATSHAGPVAPSPLHPPVRRADRLSAVLDRHEVPLAVTGHNHWPAVGRLGGTRTLAAPATCSFPPGMVVLDVSPDGTTVTFLPLADREGFLEAYRHAVAGSERSRAIAARVSGGHFEELPFVDAAGAGDGSAQEPLNRPAGGEYEALAAFVASSR
ncbi:MAG: metallophosphoesterase [Halobacterium sp.]